MNSAFTGNLDGLSLLEAPKAINIVCERLSVRVILINGLIEFLLRRLAARRTLNGWTLSGCLVDEKPNFSRTWGAGSR